MDIQKEVKEFLVKWKYIDKQDISENLLETINHFNKIKNIDLFFKLVILNLERENHRIIYNLKKLNDKEKKKCISAFNEEIEKINNLKRMYSIFKEKREIKLNKKITIVDEEAIDNQIEDDIEHYDVVTLLTNLLDLIKNSDINLNKKLINKYTKYINYELSTYLYDKKEVPDEFLYLLDALNNKISHVEKMSEERKILKDVQKQLKPIYSVYKDAKKVKEEINPYFQIIDYWLQDENNYLYLKELTKRMPNCVNVHEKDTHIVIYILDEYINNMKKMFKDKNSNYVNVNYLKEVYLLFTKNYRIHITNEEKEIIKQKIKDFIKYINTTLIKQKRKNKAILEIKAFSPDLYYMPKEQIRLYDMNDDYIYYEAQRIYKELRNTNNVEANEEAFSINSNRAYSIVETDNSIYLNMYAIDFHQYITRNSIMNRYLENLEVTKEKMEPFVIRKFLYKENENYLAINYQLEFHKSGKIKGLKIYRTTIKITDNITTYDYENEKFKEIYKLYSIVANKNGIEKSKCDLSKINTCFEYLLNDEYVKFIKEKRLPFIYYGSSIPDKQTIEKNANDLGNILCSLNKSESSEIRDIYTRKLDKFHYSAIPILNSEYKLSLLNQFNYLGIENQRMLGELYFNLKSYEDSESIRRAKNKYLKYYIDKVSELNKVFDYVDQNEIKSSKGQIKRKIKL